MKSLPHAVEELIDHTDLGDLIAHTGLRDSIGDTGLWNSCVFSKGGVFSSHTKGSLCFPQGGIAFYHTES